MEVRVRVWVMVWLWVWGYTYKGHMMGGFGVIWLR